LGVPDRRLTKKRAGCGWGAADGFDGGCAVPATQAAVPDQEIAAIDIITGGCRRRSVPLDWT